MFCAKEFLTTNVSNLGVFMKQQNLTPLNKRHFNNAFSDGKHILMERGTATVGSFGPILFARADFVNSEQFVPFHEVDGVGIVRSAAETEQAFASNIWWASDHCYLCLFETRKDAQDWIDTAKGCGGCSIGEVSALYRSPYEMFCRSYCDLYERNIILSGIQFVTEKKVRSFCVLDHGGQPCFVEAFPLVAGKKTTDPHEYYEIFKNK